MKNIKTTNWHAWINKMPIQPVNPFGTLHVTGEGITHPSKIAVLKPRVSQGISPTVLILEIVIETSVLPTKQPQQLHHFETLEKNGQYETIEVWYDKTKVIEINEMPFIF